MMSFKRYTRNNVCQCCSRAAMAAWQIHNKAMLVSPDLRSTVLVNQWGVEIGSPLFFPFLISLPIDVEV